MVQLAFNLLQAAPSLSYVTLIKSSGCYCFSSLICCNLVDNTYLAKVSQVDKTLQWMFKFRAAIGHLRHPPRDHLPTHPRNSSKRLSSSNAEGPPLPARGLQLDTLPSWAQIREDHWGAGRERHTNKDQPKDCLARNVEQSESRNNSSRSKTRHHLSRVPRLSMTFSGANRYRRKSDLGRKNLRDSILLSGSLESYNGVPSNSWKSKDSVRATFAAYLELIHFPISGELDDYNVTDRAESALKEVFTLARLTKLALHGYTVEDIATWAWIITASDADLSVQRLVSAAAEARSRKLNVIPTFVALQILRSDHLNLLSIDLLLQDAKSRIPNPSYAHKAENVSWLVWDHGVATLLIVRLLRHARRAAPEKYLDIASLACGLLRNFTGEGRVLEPKEFQRLSFSYNRILSLLALPLPISPFRSVQIQQQAQFRLLRNMLEFNPNLPVSREGYRGLISTQVAHRKTTEEQQWALVKSPSWPPWREHKMGIDEDTQYSGSYSRASKFLSRMVEAGYGHSNWENAAQILAGWDTDKSPTIQFRSLTDRGRAYWLDPYTSTKETINAKKVNSTEITWAARVRATRTIREAWACFCAFKSDSDADQAYNVYHAMFQKLMAPVASPSTRSLPGDGKERWPDPISPQDFLYLTTEPPSIDELYERMIADGVRPAGRLLSDLLDGPCSLEKAVTYIQNSAFSEVKKDVLLCAEKYPPDFIRDVLASFPDYFFAAFLRMLLRNRLANGSIRFYAPSSASEKNEMGRTEVYPASYAFLMLRISETAYVPAWLTFFEALVARLRSHHSSRTRTTEAERCWRSTITLVHLMQSRKVPLDFELLSVVLRIISEVLLHLRQVSASQAQSMARDLFTETATPGQRKSSPWLSCDYDSSTLRPPSPGVLWLLVRVLGMAQDINGLMSLLRWMNHFEAKLTTVRYELANGAEILQSTIILIRILLEGSWAPQVERRWGIPSIATPEQLQEAIRLVEGHEASPGWPDDEEVADYLERHKHWRQRLMRAMKARNTRVGMPEHVY